MSGGLPGFHNAPVSRAVVVAAALFSVPFGFRGRFLDLGLSYEGAHTATQNPMESSVGRLVSMAFDHVSAVQGLALTNYDVNLASKHPA